jgi:hypothetical protein
MAYLDRRWRMLARTSLTLGIFGLFSSCASLKENSGELLSAYNENDHRIDPDKVRRFVDDEVKLLSQLTRLGQPIYDGTTTNWRPTVDAGLLYVDVRCQGYIQALFSFERLKTAAGREAKLVGATASAALALFEASKELIGLTPLGFTLVDETIDNLGDSILFALPPSAVNQLLKERQAAYRAGLPDVYSDQPAALQAIQNYAVLCLSADIEGAAVDAIAKQKFKAKDPAPEAISTPTPTGSPTPTPSPTSAPTPAPTESAIPANTVPVLEQI